MEANDSDVVRQLTVQERPGTFCFRFWQEGPGFDRKLFSAEAASSSIDYIHTTALTTGVALVPLLVTGNKPGQAIEYPMAFVILGGLITSTLLNLLVLPSLFAKFGHRNPRQSDGAGSQIHL